MYKNYYKCRKLYIDYILCSPAFNKNQFLTEIDSYLQTMGGVKTKPNSMWRLQYRSTVSDSYKKLFENFISCNGMNLMDLGITREASTTKTSHDLYLTNIDKNQGLVESISYEIEYHYPVTFRQTKSMIKPKIKAIKRRRMSLFTNKTLFKKYKKGTGN